MGPVLTCVMLGTVGAKWLVVVTLAGKSLELSNIGLLFSLGIFGCWVLPERGFRSIPVLNVLLLLLLLLLGGLMIRGDPIDIVVMSIAHVLGAYAVATIARVDGRISVLGGFLGIFGFLALSVMISGVDVLFGVLDYLRTLDRDRFAFQVLRPIYNAFVTDNTDEITVQINNALCAAFVLIYMIAGSHAVLGNRMMALVCVLCLAMVFTIFSSSAVLAAAASTLIFGFVAVMRVRGFWQIYVLVGLTLLGGMALAGGISEYLVANVADDTGSRDQRIEQYTAALDLMDRHIWLGTGYVEVSGHSIHNFFLFSFVSVGVAGGVLSLAVFVLAAGLSLKGCRLLLTEREVTPPMVMLACLPILFVLRSLVGGAGGLPTGPGILALGFALAALRQLQSQGAVIDEPTRRGAAPRRRDAALAWKA
ncbi:O-antigen ligase family protein [Roseivivax halodurans]|uniref:O-antigen ligase family protein n=1 Tax=Roseivivax halodurans TaxID=93683 RepID=UPI0012FA99F2|nr:O-antigen ligase family protein [Roseivivax halodurans]